MKKPVVVAIIFVLVVLAVIIISTLRLARYRVEVCMTFNGHTNCGKAGADTEEHALRSATDNACVLIASGVTESMACERTPPTSVRWLKR